jgi:hypothetical protein
MDAQWSSSPSLKYFTCLHVLSNMPCNEFTSLVLDVMDQQDVAFVTSLTKQVELKKLEIVRKWVEAENAKAETWLNDNNPARDLPGLGRLCWTGNSSVVVEYCGNRYSIQWSLGLERVVMYKVEHRGVPISYLDHLPLELAQVEAFIVDFLQKKYGEEEEEEAERKRQKV